jgi:iron complex outermembrane receptor protein
MTMVALGVIACATAPALSIQAGAQNGAQEASDQIHVIGSRNARARSATDSPVPVDVISGDQFNALGNAADLTDNLRLLVPSYTATPATGDGSAFIRPTSLRGMAPDQTLILVNGKRRHRSALVQFFAPAAGNGAHGVDVGMIPGIALQRVEVLRDGAAAQYGSDAIAGVINFVTRTESQGGQAVAQYGQFYEGESSYKLAGNVGLPLGENGYLNISAEFYDNEALSRGIQRADAQALIDGGVTGVGSDSPFGDAPFVQSWGRPETSGLRTFFTAGVDLQNGAELYAFGNYADTDGRYRFFYRVPNHSSILPLQALGFTGLPGGYTPYLDGAQTDLSLVGGLRGEWSNGLNYDFSIGFGQNELDYFLNNTLNPSLGLVGGQPAQRDFDVGGYEQQETNINADFSRPVGDTMNLAFGLEWREETYTINPGEPNSYFGSGSNGLGGFRPEDSGDFSRDNIAIYADLEQDVSDDFMVQYALRYEDFSDFGETINGKIAARYTVSDELTLRGAISTGFHAPTPGQANVRTTITTFDGTSGLQVEEGLVPATSPLALLAGGAPLSEEKSVNFSVGFASQLSEGTNLTVDFYRIDVEDRIYRTGDIQPIPGNTQTISFYTNALELESQGVDVVLTSGADWSRDVSTDLTLALNFNEIDVVGQTPVGGVNPVSAATIEDIENNYPSLRFVASANTHIGDRWDVLVRGNYYGSHYDERGTIGAAVSPTAEIDATVYFDVEVGFDVNEQVRIVGGASNIFDTYVGEIGAPNSNRLSVGLQYPRRSAANYEGGSWYLRTIMNF